MTKPNSVSRNGSVFQGVRWSAVGRGASAILQLISTLVIFAILSVEAVGLMAMVRVILGFGEQLREIGSKHAVVQRDELTQDLLGAAWVINLATGASLALAAVVVAPAAAWFFDDARVLSLVAVTGIIFAIDAIGQVPRALLIRSMKFRELAIVDLLTVITTSSVSIGFALGGYDVWSLVYGEIIGVSVAVIALQCFQTSFPQVATSRAELLRVLKFGGNMVGFTFSNYAFQNADRMVIGAALGPMELGLYSFAQRVVLFPMRTLSSLVASVLIPSFSKDQGNDQLLAQKYGRALAGIALVVFPMLAGAGIAAEPLIRLYDTRWLEAALLISLLCPAGMIQSQVRTVGALFVAKGRPGLLFAMSTVVGTITLAGYLFGIAFGLVGVVIGFSVATVISAYPTLRLAAGLIGSTPRALLGPSWPIVSAVVAAAFSVLVFRWLVGTTLDDTLYLLIGGTLGGAVYVACLMALKPAALYDFSRLVSLPGLSLKSESRPM